MRVFFFLLFRGRGLPTPEAVAEDVSRVVAAEYGRSAAGGLGVVGWAALENRSSVASTSLCWAVFLYCGEKKKRLRELCFLVGTVVGTALGCSRLGACAGTLDREVSLLLGGVACVSGGNGLRHAVSSVSFWTRRCLGGVGGGGKGVAGLGGPGPGTVRGVPGGTRGGTSLSSVAEREGEGVGGGAGCSRK